MKNRRIVAVVMLTSLSSIVSAAPVDWARLDHKGFYVTAGLGSFGLHERVLCPAAYGGCNGDEPIQFTTPRKLLALEAGLGFRISRYLAIESMFGLLGSRHNGTPDNPTAQWNDVDLSGVLDAQFRLRADLPLTRELAVYGTAGVGHKSSFMTLTEPNVFVSGDCVAWIDPLNPNLGCARYSVQVLRTELDTSSTYFPVSVGLEWWVAPTWAISVNYQPPIGKDFAFSRTMLEFIVNLSDSR